VFAPVPLPPINLTERVGVLPSGVKAETSYLEIGVALRRAVEDCLPPAWTWHGKRVLDFGCGAGRVLRDFVREAHEAESWGSNIHAPSIDWCRNILSPPAYVTTFSPSARKWPIYATDSIRPAWRATHELT
jgi:SAM-dependent methyltransferase